MTIKNIESVIKRKKKEEKKSDIELFFEYLDKNDD